MTNEEVFPFYAALWKRLPVEDLYIHYLGLGPRGAAGCFDHDGQGGFHKPEIGITREFHIEPDDEPSMVRSDGTPVDLAEEMMTLAHEYGHFLSFEGGTPIETWTAYLAAAIRRDAVFDALPDGTPHDACREAVSKALSDEERTLIVAEETRAWDLGRQFVPVLLLAAYEERARLGVHIHKYRLGIDPLWPEELAASAPPGPSDH